jgi:ferric-dicitrate binding protein FerR (iron transport regulator)
MSDHDRIVLLLSRRIAGELNPAEAEELRIALEQDPALRELLSAVEGLTDAPPAGLTERDELQMTERGLRQWRQRAAGLPIVPRAEVEVEAVVAMEEEGRPLRLLRPRIIRWSAAAAAVVLATWGVFHYTHNKPATQPAAQVAWHEVAAKYGTRSYLELPDGSKLWLNAGSKVRYADGFATGKRELNLSGEGFFDVKHDPAQPFLIHAGTVDVRVLGTSLNVRAYPGDPTIETTLIQGKAEIEPGNGVPPIVLRPSEKVTMRNSGLARNGTAGGNGGTDANGTAAGSGVAGANGSGAAGANGNGAAGATANPGKDGQPLFERHSISADPTYKTIIETSWVEDKLVFRKEPFREVAAKLERWYNIRFHFQNEKYLDEELTGYFKDQPIKNVMDGLQLSLGFHYEIAGDSILIH